MYEKQTDRDRTSKHHKVTVMLHSLPPVWLRNMLTSVPVA